ncbi:MAG: 50S ribosomal protein L24 [Patescibacteria group bacterium]|nr:50S ribosomal protein L24 [Patescibacteria group bacterium]
MKIKKGDKVKVLVGKDVGKQGKVLRILKDKRKIVVEGVNVYKKHVKGDGRNRESAIVDLVMPVDVSNVMLVCASCGKPARIIYQVKNDKSKVRICKKCGKPIDGSGASETKAAPKVRKSDKTARTKPKSKK